MDVVLLSRIQFALTIMFHYLFPPLTIGLGLLIVLFETQHMRTGDPKWRAVVNFWVKLFAVSFAIGVASGIVMEFQFGTNWAAYSRFVGDVFGSALAAEGIFAFFLESGFLAVLVFGRGRVGRKFYYFSTWMVFLGSVFSSVWIVIANSWQQTPAGSHVVQMMKEGKPWFNDAGEPVMRAEIVDFWGVVFNPSSINRLTHVWTGCLILGGLFVMSVCAYYVLKNRHLAMAKPCFQAALVVMFVSSLLALMSGDSNARMVAKLQPAKLAAMEGHIQTGDGPSGIHLFGIPSFTEEKIYMPIEIPGLLSMMVYREFPPKTPVIGLDAIPEEDRPPIAIPFIAFHTMVGLGTLFILLGVVCLFYWWRGTLFEKRWLMWVCVVMVIGGFVANQAGWVAAEVGRQPWIVHPKIVKNDDGYAQLDADGRVVYETMPKPAPGGGTDGTMLAALRTQDAHSTVVQAEQVLGSIIMFGLIYTLLFFVWVYVLNEKIKKGPALPGEDEATGEDQGTTSGGLLNTAMKRTGHTGSLTGARDANEATNRPAAQDPPG